MRRSIVRLIALAAIALTGFAATHSVGSAHLAGGYWGPPAPLAIPGSN